MFRNTVKLLFLLLLAVLTVPACKIDPLEDPNNPGLDPISENATIDELQNLVTGLEGGMRIDMDDYFIGTGMIGRELYRFSASDPRFTSDLLGKNDATMDGNTFYTTLPFQARYRVIKNANILITAITNTTAITDDRQRVATRGFANTIKAHQLLIVWGMQYDNGIRIEVGDADNPGPFVGTGDPKEALRAINALLDEGYGQLTADTTATFPFRLSSGFAGFDQPVTFAEFNRALAARVQLYNENYAQALTALEQSFLDLSEQNLDLGVYHIFSAGGGDLLNPLWFPATATGESLLSHPSFVADAEAGDDRLSKAAIRPDTVNSDDLSSNYNFTRYANNTAPIPIVRNEELILIYAEANVHLDNFTEAVDALNIIRNAHGLPDYAGPQDKASLIDEVLRQRRYSLFGEGHRWIDLRRYDRLGELPLDRPNDDVWVRYPVPATEGN